MYMHSYKMSEFKKQILIKCDYSSDSGIHLVRMEVMKNSTKCKSISPTCGHVLNFHSTVAFGA